VHDEVIAIVVDDSTTTTTSIIDMMLMCCTETVCRFGSGRLLRPFRQEDDVFARFQDIGTAFKVAGMLFVSAVISCLVDRLAFIP
jgi:hypothetical protein